MKLKKFGIIMLVVGGVLNFALIKMNVGGIVRELTRLSLLLGLIFFLIGFFKEKNRP